MKKRLALFLIALIAAGWPMQARAVLKGSANIALQPNGGTGYIPVAQYGALGTSSDDCPAIQNAINAAEAQGSGTINSITGVTGGTVSFQGIIYKCATPLTFDPGTVSFEWNGAIIDATQISSGQLFTVAQTAGGSTSGMLAGLQQARKNKFRNACFIGPGIASSVDLFLFNTTANSSYNSSRMSFDHICAVGFRRGESYENGAYLIHGTDIEYNLMSDCFYMGSGFSSYGEAITHEGGGCYNSTVGVYSNSITGTNEQDFSHFSFDQDTMVMDDEAGIVTFDTVHAELPGSSLTGVIFKVANASGNLFRSKNMTLLIDGTTPFSGASALFEVDGSGIADLDETFANNLLLTSGYIKTGTGKFSMTHTRGFTTAHGPSGIGLYSDATQNLVQDPTFASASFLDWVFLTSASTSNATISSDNSSPCGGQGTSTHSWYINKTGSASSTVIAWLIVPVPPGSMPIADFYYSAPGTATGNVYVSFYAINVVQNGTSTPTIQNIATLGQVTVSLSGTALGWTHFANSQANSNILAPTANYVGIQINATAPGAGPFCIDNVNISTM